MDYAMDRWNGISANQIAKTDHIMAKCLFYHLAEMPLPLAHFFFSHHGRGEVVSAVLPLLTST